MNIIIILSCLIGVCFFVCALYYYGFSFFSIVILIGAWLTSFLLFNVVVSVAEEVIPQTEYYDNLEWKVASEQKLVKENDYTYMVYVRYGDTDKFYVNFSVENESFGVKEKIIISNAKSKILFHYSDAIEPVVVVEEAIPNRFVRLFFPKFYRYHFIVPEDKVVETYIE